MHVRACTCKEEHTCVHVCMLIFLGEFSHSFQHLRAPCNHSMMFCLHIVVISVAVSAPFVRRSISYRFVTAFKCDYKAASVK